MNICGTSLTSYRDTTENVFTFYMRLQNKIQKLEGNLQDIKLERN